MDFKDNQLLLKYIVDDAPFKFIWKLSEISEEEFQNSFTNPLLFCLEVLRKENDMLKDVIVKKDLEIEQFKLEGAVLRRSKYSCIFSNTDAFRFDAQEAENKIVNHDKNLCTQINLAILIE